ncbi:MAG: PH domain-containing protein [Duncaniella sp.]|nr:PH domain-containing protein [Duncaniella sp.]
MKKRVKYTAKSYFWPILSVLAVGAVAWSRYQRHGDMFYFWLFAGLLALMVILMLFFSPVSVSVTDGGVILKSLLGSKTIPFDKIVKVKEFIPSATAKSPFGSRDWLGTWGWFKDNRIGRYRAFYGNPDECFLVTLSDGKMFLIGCDDHAAVMDAIREKCNLTQNR